MIVSNHYFKALVEEEKKSDYQNFGGMDDEEVEEDNTKDYKGKNQNYQQEEEDPYQNDDKTYQDHFRKTFITENQKKPGVDQTKSAWTLHDMIIPAGKTAKLIRIKSPGDKDFRISEICDKLKFINATPVIVLAGAMTQRAYIFYL